MHRQTSNKSMQILILSVIILTILQSCAFLSPYRDLPPEFMSKEEVLSVIQKSEYPSQEDYPDVSGIVIYDKVIMDEISFSHSQRTIKKILKVFKNIDLFNQVKLFLDDSEELIWFKGRVIKPSGAVIELTEQDIITTSFKFPGTDYESKVIISTFKGIEPNSIIEYVYKLKIKSEVRHRKIDLQEDDLPKLYSNVRIQWNRRMEYIISSKYNRTIIFFTLFGNPFNWRAYLNDIDGDGNGTLFNEGNLSIQEWIFRDIPAFKYEILMPPPSHIKARIEYSTKIESWNNLTQWYNESYFKGQSVAGPNTIAKAVKLVADCSSELDTITKLSRYVQSLTYHAIPLGWDGFKPHLPDSTVVAEFGDCKDKSTLLFAMLRHFGIECYPALVLTMENGFTIKDKIEFNFNHMIVLIKTRDGKSYWCDPTVKYASLNQLPYQIEGVLGLSFNENGIHELVPTPMTDYHDNQELIDIKMKIDSSKALFDVVINYYGQNDLIMRNSIEMLEFDQVNMMFKSLILDKFVDADISNLRFSDISNTDQNFAAQFSFEVDNAIEKQGDLCFVNFDPIKIFDNLDFLTKSERKYPIYFDFQNRKEKKITIQFPEKEYDVKSLPEKIEKICDELYYSKEFNLVDESKIEIKEIIENQKNLVPVVKYNEFKSIFSTIQKRANDKIILIEKRKSIGSN